VEVRALAPNDRFWVERLIRERWGSDSVAAHGTLYRPAELRGFAALEDGNTVGLVTYEIDGHACEIVTIDSLTERRGVGSALVEAVAEAARAEGCSRLWLITTNDNLPARRFYEKRGFSLAAVHANAVAESRRLKPEIPLVGFAGVPIRDELELELKL
jgi:ribosomal protein S18 acetylase RimI-like enzyme